MRPNDPIEAIVYDALTEAGIMFMMTPLALDFYLPGSDVHIECKQYHSPRISRQMGRFPNVIAVQGREAADLFAKLITAPHA